MTKTLADIAQDMAGIDIAILSTHTENGEIANRPMSDNGDVAYDGTSYYFSYEQARAISDIERDPKVALGFSSEAGLFSEGIYVAVEGTAEFFRRVRQAGLRVAVGSSAKGDELKTYLEIAGIADLIDVEASSEDADRSKPSADIFEVVLQKLNMEGRDAVAIGDTPYDAEASVKAKITPVGVLSGGFTEASLRQAGCVAVYAGPAALFAGFAQSVIVTR